VRWETWLASDDSWARRRLKHLSWRSRWIILFTLEWRMAVSCEISRADRFLFGLSSWHEHIRVLHCYATNVVCRCLVTGQLNPSCGFSSAHCRCFQVSISCLAIHLTAFAHYTALKDSDFLVRIASSCEIFMILFNFYWCLSLDSFRR